MEQDTQQSPQSAQLSVPMQPLDADQVTQGHIKYNKFKCNDMNKSFDKPNQANKLPSSADPPTSQVITFEEMHHFKDRYEITKNTVQDQTTMRKLVAQDSLNVTELTPSQASKGHTAPQEYVVAPDVLELNQSAESLYVFQMNEAVDDFKDYASVDNCPHVTKLERMDQLFGFFAEQPNFQK